MLRFATKATQNATGVENWDQISSLPVQYEREIGEMYEWYFVLDLGPNLI